MLQRIVELSRRTALLAAVLALLAGSPGCSDSDDAPANTPKQVALPRTLFSSQRPATVVRLREAKAGSKAGDTVTFEARIGGRVDPFVGGRALMLVADPGLESCESMADSCKTPWDYCCEARESLLDNTATVRVVDSEGQIVATSLQGAGGLAPLRTVIVTGTVAETSPATFLIDATSLHVPPRSP